jgi:hypothetical protein
VPVEDAPKKKRKKGTSPTKLSLAELRKRGLTAQVVEYWNSFAKPFGRRVDLFGCIDIVAITPAGILGIQACVGSTHANRRTKILNEARLREWVDAGGRFEIWSWTKRANGRWELRAEDMAPALRALSACVEAREPEPNA